MEQGQALDEKNSAKLVKDKPAQTVADQPEKRKPDRRDLVKLDVMREMMMGKQKAPVVEKVTSCMGTSRETSLEPSIVQEQEIKEQEQGHTRAVQEKRRTAQEQNG
ncbi:hypothetical protein F511_17752 [Dorcoceras hygrometricum]|uniref:Uncharacterized protein n=1 Tax=Dorcoceras hygrometricum TaxID=472368 RepID=A0A2Z7B5Q0_9LAMI|nr:hypothetical protein F511_17752 [Dorcoceras hygrometricum]